MSQIYDFFDKLFSASSWPARWHCGRWTAFHGWLYIISSVLIALAYFSIPIIFYYLIKKAKDKLPFRKIFWLFLLFILACGFTHVMDALVFWVPAYRVSAVILFATALVSWMAVIGLYKVIPTALTLKSPEMLERIIAERTQQLEKINKDLRKTNLELNESKINTLKLMNQKDEFLSIASHELKTPVTSLKGYTQMLLMMQHNHSAEVAQMHVKMNAQVNRLTILINDLLDVNKIQEGGLVYNKEDINLTEIIKGVTEDMQHTYPAYLLELSATDGICIYADQNRIVQVINNLISNAVKYSKPGSKVIITLTEKNNMAVCTVQDFGLGIAEAQQDKVFDKYYRVTGNNLSSYPGLGLGLYISKDIISKHNGRIWLESEEGKGSLFSFSLPN